MSNARKELSFGIIVLAVGLVYFFLTVQLPRKGAIDSATAPYLLSLLMVGLGIAQIAVCIRKQKSESRRAKSLKSEVIEIAGHASAAAAPLSSRPDYKTVASTALLILLYVVFLNYFGFLVMSALYLFLQISLLTPMRQKKRYFLYCFIAVTVSVVIYYTFLWAFDIMLPHGDFWYDRGIDLEWYPF